MSLRGVNAQGIEVYETDTDVMNLTWEDRKKEYLKLLSNDFKGKTAKFTRNGHTYYAEFDSNSIRKHIYGDKRSSPKGKQALIKTGANGNVFELVENSEYEKSRKNTKMHTNADYFYYFIKTVQIDNKVFDLVIDIRKNMGLMKRIYTLWL